MYISVNVHVEEKGQPGLFRVGRKVLVHHFRFIVSVTFCYIKQKLNERDDLSDIPGMLHLDIGNVNDSGIVVPNRPPIK